MLYLQILCFIDEKVNNSKDVLHKGTEPHCLSCIKMIIGYNLENLTIENKDMQQLKGTL